MCLKATINFFNHFLLCSERIKCLSYFFCSKCLTSRAFASLWRTRVSSWCIVASWELSAHDPGLKKSRKFAQNRAPDFTRSHEISQDFVRIREISRYFTEIFFVLSWTPVPVLRFFTLNRPGWGIEISILVGHTSISSVNFYHATILSRNCWTIQ